MFLDFVRQSVPAVKSTSDAELVAQGQAVCSGLKAGKKITDLLPNQSDITSSAVVAGFAVGTFCPDQRSKL
nr:DUF732 domain-containing protein [Streptomyces sp. SID3343]